MDNAVYVIWAVLGAVAVLVAIARK